MFGCIRHAFSIHFPFQKHGLYNQIAIKTAKLFQQPIESKSRGIGNIQLPDTTIRYGVEFQYIIFNLIQCQEDILLMEHGRVREHGNLSLREKTVTGFNRIIDNIGKFRVHGRFTIPSKSDYIGSNTLCLHGRQFIYQSLLYLCTGWQFTARTVILV